jgi:hypothetical protein
MALVEGQKFIENQDGWLKAALAVFLRPAGK